MIQSRFSDPLKALPVASRQINAAPLSDFFYLHKTVNATLKIIKVQLRLFIKYFVAVVWIINGLLCKILNLVPRHEAIVARVFGNTHAHLYVIIIGIGEVCLAIWTLGGQWPRLNAVSQVLVIVGFNILGYLMAPDLLLFGSFSYIVAFLFILLVCYNGFWPTRNP